MKVLDQNTESVINSALTVFKPCFYHVPYFSFKGGPTKCKITINFNIALSSTRLQSANAEHLNKNIKTLTCFSLKVHSVTFFSSSFGYVVLELSDF